MAAQKTKETNADVIEFINAVNDTEQKKKDSLELLKHFQRWTGYEPKLWGASIIGFGKYHYKYEKTKHEGDSMIVGFSPRKSAISLYVYSDTQKQKELLEKLGKFKMGKSCIYVKKLSDIHLEVLEAITRDTVKFIHQKYG